MAEAYVGVLRARRDLDTNRSNVEQLASFAGDVKNRLDQGLAIRSDDLAAQVSLANAQLGEIQARTALESAWATYNRYLCRPLDQYVELEEVSRLPTDESFWERLAAQVVANRGRFAGQDDAEARDLTVKGLRLRPELAGLVEQARSYRAQADATRANLRPQVTVNGGFLYTGADNFIPQGNGLASVHHRLDPDRHGQDPPPGRGAQRPGAGGGQAPGRPGRRRGLADPDPVARPPAGHQRKVPIARFAVTQAEENVKVITDRYRQQLATYTEVLDAENRRIASINNFYAAVYDENLADFRLRRAVGDI